MPRRTLAALPCLAAVAAVALGGCRRAPSDAEQIRALVEDAARAAAEKRVSDAVAGVSDAFHGEGLDRQGVKQLVAFHVLRGGWLALLVADTRIEVRGDDADAVADVVLSRTRKSTRVSELLAAEATVHRFTLRLARERDGWKVVSAAWRPISVAELLEGGPTAPR